MSRRGENIYKRKDGRWEGRYRKKISGGSVRYGYVYAHTYKEVKVKLSAARALAAKASAVTEGMLFSELSEKWLSVQLINSKSSTVSRYSSMLDNRILPVLGKLNTLDITTDTLQDFLAYLLKSGSCVNNKGLSEKTAADTIGLVKSVLRYGEKINVRHSCALSAVTVRVPQKEIRVLTRDEYKKLTAYLLGENSFSSVGILTALYTGIRIGELCALTFGDIDIDGTQDANQQKNYYGEYYITDTGHKYHRADCIFVKNKENVRRLTEEEFFSGDYEPCEMCLPE